MTYNPSTDFIGLWRTITGGVEKGEMPGLDWLVAALGRAGLVNVSVSGTAPTANQATTAWFVPANPSYSAEGGLYLWSATASAYLAATPSLFYQFLAASYGSSAVSWFATTGGAPLNTVGNNGDFAIRTDSPGGIYGPKANGAWPSTPLPGTSYSEISAALDYAFGNPAQGSVLFRGAAGWQVLAPGTNGYTLTSGGSGANPSWTSLSNTVNSAAFDSSFGNTVGNIVYRAGGGWQSLAIGATNNILTSTGTAPAWSSLSGAIDSGVLGNPTSQGAILYRGSASWTALAPGTSGYVLTSGGAAANPSWTSPAAATVNSSALDSAFGATVGGVLVRGTSGWTNLIPGTAGYVLQTNGAGSNPSWAAPTTGSTSSYAIGSTMVAADYSALYGYTGAIGVGNTSTFSTSNSTSAQGFLVLSPNDGVQGPPVGVNLSVPGTWRVLGYIPGVVGQAGTLGLVNVLRVS
jgi:hypothetical protein